MSFNITGALFEDVTNKTGLVETGAAPTSERSLIDVMAHPVTRVFVDRNAIVCYERYGADPIRLNPISPIHSRTRARELAMAVCEHIPEVRGVKMNDAKISEAMGIGLSYRDLVMQTRAAILHSYEAEQGLTDAAYEKAKRYGLI